MQNNKFQKIFILTILITNAWTTASAYLLIPELSDIKVTHETAVKITDKYERTCLRQRPKSVCDAIGLQPIYYVRVLHDEKTTLKAPRTQRFGVMYYDTTSGGGSNFPVICNLDNENGSSITYSCPKPAAVNSTTRSFDGVYIYYSDLDFLNGSTTMPPTTTDTQTLIDSGRLSVRTQSSNPCSIDYGDGTTFVQSMQDMSCAVYTTISTVVAADITAPNTVSLNGCTVGQYCAGSIPITTRTNLASHRVTIAARFTHLAPGVNGSFNGDQELPPLSLTTTVRGDASTDIPISIMSTHPGNTESAVLITATVY